MAKQITNRIPTARDSIKGGIFFNSSLTPSGSFSNIPSTVTSNVPDIEQEARLILTLKTLQEQLQYNAAIATGVDDADPLSQTTINIFLIEFAQLLINYADLRNSVFFGSAYTELAYHINQLIATYPFRSFFARDINLTTPVQLTTLSGGKTQVTFESIDILEQAGYSYKEDNITNWTNFDLVDQNGTRFPILNIAAPSYIAVTNATTVPGPVSISTAPTPHNFLTGDQIELEVYDSLGDIVIQGTFEITVTSPTDFDLIDYTLVAPYVFDSGIVRLERNQAYDNPPYIISLVVEGLISSNNFIEYQRTPSELFKGLMVVPKIQVSTDFNAQLPPLQAELISKTNPTPWPRNPITDNLIVEGTEFDEWISNPTNMFTGDVEDIGFISLEEGFNLTGATGLDETETNQLLRRAIPHRVVNELNDTDDRFFSRFILIAGKYFDEIKVYIDFVRFTHHLNYSQFNQLSPEYYQLYAEHYGFGLFNEDNIDLGQLVIRTEPGLRYDVQNNPVFDDSNTARTLRELRFEQQKRVLINLLYLYKTKGTQTAIKFLISALGAPEGLVQLREYAFDIDQKTSDGYALHYTDPTNVSYEGTKIVDNEKVKVPEQSFEIDPTYSTIEYTTLIEILAGSTSSYIDIVLVSPSGAQTIDLNALTVWNTNTVITASNLADNINSAAIAGISASVVDNIVTISTGLEYLGWLPNNNGLGISLGPLSPLSYSVKTPVWKLRLNNSETWNLREMGIATNPQAAIGNDIIQYGTSQFSYGRFFHRSYANLQRELGEYYALPLTFPDKYYSTTIEYMLPRNSLFKGGSIRPDQSQIDLCSLYEINGITYSPALPAPNALPVKLTGTFNYPSPPVAAIGGFTVDTIVGPASGFVEVNAIPISNTVAYTTDAQTTAALIADSINAYPSLPEYTAEAIGDRVIIYAPRSDGSIANGYPVTMNGTISISDITDMNGGEDEIHPTRSFIIVRLEGRDLVIRLRLSDEVAPYFRPAQRVAIYKDFFVEDGLNHQLRLKFRPYGVEVEHDFKHLATLEWLDPLTAASGPALAWDITTEEIETCSPSLFPVNQFLANPINTGDDLPRWWDLFIGNPILCNFNFLRVAVSEMQAIMHPDSLATGADFVTGFESEIYSFNFSQNASPTTDAFEIPCIFKQPNPLFSTIHYLPIGGNDTIPDLNLYNKQFGNTIPGRVVQEVKPQHFYEIAEALTFDSLVKYNAWTPSLHKDYHYDKLLRAWRSYLIFSEQVLTYQALLPFLELVESQFRNLVLQFIPIVINLSDFGRIISNLFLYRPKVRYPNIHKTCQAQVAEAFAIGSFELTYGTYDVADHISIDIDTGSGLINLITAEPWVSNNVTTLQNIADSINTNWNPQITAEQCGNTLVLRVSPNWYEGFTSGLDINQALLTVTPSGTVTVANTQDFQGGVLSQSGNGQCFTFTRTPLNGFISKNEDNYIYFADENTNPTFIYNANEGVPPLWINFDNE